MRVPAAVHTFAVTGGPCSGKTTGLAHLLRQGVPGHQVFVVPEAATLYHEHGARVPFGTARSQCGRIDEDGRNVLWEMLLNELKRSLETRAVNTALKSTAEGGSPAVVLCDRGIIDSRAYLPSPRAWQCMLQLAGWDVSSIASRYDHVFHMALCPEEAYNQESNRARRETFAEAAELDGKTLAAWRPTHRAAQSLVGGDLSAASGLDAKLEALALAVEERLELDAAQPQPQQSVGLRDGEDRGTRKVRGFHLPPREIIALADTVASAPDLSMVAPAAVSIVRRIQRVDSLPPDERDFPAEACHRYLRRSAGALGRVGLGNERTAAMRAGRPRRIRRMELEVDALLSSPAW